MMLVQELIVCANVSILTLDKYWVILWQIYTSF